jgi:hypothetical protein
MTEDVTALTTALGQAVSTARTIDHALANLNQLIATRATEAAQPLIEQARQNADRGIALAEAESDRLQRLVNELRRQIDAALRARDQAITDLRTQQATPRAYPTRPLTPDQERSVRNNECRTDWPTWQMPCDPIVTVAGSIIAIGCAENPGVIVQTGSCSWSALAATVARHRCVPASKSTGQETNHG